MRMAAHHPDSRRIVHLGVLRRAPKMLTATIDWRAYIRRHLLIAAVTETEPCGSTLPVVLHRERAGVAQGHDGTAAASVPALRARSRRAGWKRTPGSRRLPRPGRCDS